MGIDYRPAAYPAQGVVRRAAQPEVAAPYGVRTRGFQNSLVAVRRSDGTLLTLGDLPDAQSRWTRMRKRAVTECIDHGLLSPELARRRYRLTDSELGEWRAHRRGKSPVAWMDRPRVVVAGTVRRGELAIDLDARAVQLGGAPLTLSASEWKVLATIAEASGEIVTSAMIMGALYGDAETSPGAKIVDVLICRLRRKLGPEAGRLAAVWGRGYFLAD